MRIGLLLAFVFYSTLLNAQNQWYSLVNADEQWSYFIGDNAPPELWYQQNFDDSGWQTGIGGFGYGDGDDATIIPQTISVFIRREFTINDLSSLESIYLLADYDDGFVAYLNGTEIARSGLSAEFPNYQQTAISHEASLYQGLQPEYYDITENILPFLNEGVNTLAIQIHNRDFNSSDLSSNFYLVGEFSSSQSYSAAPNFFQEPISFQSSDLPIFKINTNGQSVQNDQRIIAQMEVINNGSDIRNNVDDFPTDYNGRISIEYRGSSSLGFPKKSYRLETQLSDGSNNNVPLLGLPQENDWVLYAPYSDKSLIRNVLTYHLGELMGRYSPRTRFVELVVNEEYRGVYILTETIKRDAGRLDIATMLETDNSGDELTGGYIWKADRPDPEGGNWDGFYPNNNTTHRYQVVYPRPEVITSQQFNYLKEFVYDFETEIYDGNINDPFSGFSQLADEASFVDFFLVNELSKNVDAYRLSAFFYKDKITDGGKVYAGPLWDFNLAFGNANYCGGEDYSGWMYSYQCGAVPFYWERLMDGYRFQFMVKERWETLRKGILTTESMNIRIDSLANIVRESQRRNFQKWQVLGQYVWPNWFIGRSFQEEVDYLKSWTSNRLLEMDRLIGNLNPEFDYQMLAEYETYAWPNPFTDQLRLRFASEIYGPLGIQITNLLGQQVAEWTLVGENPGVYEVNIPGEKWLNQQSGIYIINIWRANSIIDRVKVIKK